MTDPNTTYKLAHAALTVKLGRAPDTRDAEYWQLPGSPSAKEGRACIPRSEKPENHSTVQPAAPNAPTTESGQDDARVGAAAGATTTSGALNPPGINPPAPEAVSEPLTAERINPGIPGPAGDPSGLTFGVRGPLGGVVARCEGCGRLWERERRRGRPSYRCGECR